MSKEITKSDFLYIVYLTLQTNPDWMTDTINRACQSVIERSEENRRVSTNIETAFQMLYGHQFSKLNKEQQIKVLSSLLECKTIKGTKFEKEIKKKLRKQ